MFEKIKAFFQNKVTKIVSWCLLALSAVGLIIGGVTLDALDNGLSLVAGIVTAVSALIAFISGQVKKK